MTGLGFIAIYWHFTTDPSIGTCSPFTGFSTQKKVLSPSFEQIWDRISDSFYPVLCVVALVGEFACLCNSGDGAPLDPPGCLLKGGKALTKHNSKQVCPV